MTAAAPEKMTNDVNSAEIAAEIARKHEFFMDAIGLANIHVIVSEAIEAARRLSAPARGKFHCPYCDDGKMIVMGGIGCWWHACNKCYLSTRTFDTHTAAEEYFSCREPAPAPAAPRVGDGEEDFPSLPPKIVRTMKLSPSAPPAASAERDDDIALIQLIFANSKVTRATGERIVRAIFAAGYRKLAPAQSVGQSAAQGVEQAPSMQGLERKEYWGALWDAAASIFHKRPNSYWRDLFESAELWRDLERLREALNVGARLSALPKGQEHEG